MRTLATTSLALLTALLIAPSTSRGQPTSAGEPEANATTTPDELRVQLEQGISEIGQIAQQVREEADPQRLACVVDKQERAGIVMEHATDNLLTIEGSDDPRDVQFAREKLAASAERMGGLVELARRCRGVEQAGSAEAGVANAAKEPSAVPHNDPTKATPGNQPLPPPSDPGRGPTSSAVR